MSNLNLNNIENIENEEFDYNGYQVVRGEFFAHLREPSITFNNQKVYVNMACLNKSPKTEYVQILINPTEKKLVIKPCDEELKDSVSWRSNSKKLRPKQISCKIFFGKIMDLMNWNADYRYKLIGKMINTAGGSLFVFDMKTYEVFARTTKSNISSRVPSFPSDWKEQFGLPVEEHKRSLKVDIFNGYAVFDIKNTNKKTNTIF